MSNICIYKHKCKHVQTIYRHTSVSDAHTLVCVYKEGGPRKCTCVCVHACVYTCISYGKRIYISPKCSTDTYVFIYVLRLLMVPHKHGGPRTRTCVCMCVYMCVCVCIHTFVTYIYTYWTHISWQRSNKLSRQQQHRS